VVYRHALPNALVPIVTLIGLQFGVLLAGAVVTEKIFSWPGWDGWWWTRLRTATTRWCRDVCCRSG